jgi:Winged helix DNA-binding domain
VGDATGPTLTRRDLNRALLARQLLLRRERRSALETVRHLVAMQAQNPDPPYYGLWSRLEGFRADELADLVTDRSVVRIANLRSTIHLVTADDCLPLRTFVQPALDRGYAANQGKRLGGVDRDALVAAGRALVDAQPRTFGELGAALAPAFPGTDQDALSMAVRTWVPLVQVPPRGVWGRSAKAAHTSAEQWLGRRATDAAATVDPQAYARGLVLRYVGAFGPASVADVQKWSGLTRLREVVDRVLAADPGALVPLRDEDGVQLYDLPAAPRPGGDEPAPPRLLAEYDNVLLSHADRTRILGDVHPSMVMTQNGLVLGAVLVDGFVVGRWRLRRPSTTDPAATVTVTTLRRLRPGERAAVGEEAAALLHFAAPDAARHDVRFAVSTEPVSAAHG